ncbi:MAG: hypothetical protein V7760_03755 [Marinobacter sp.]
MKIVLLTMLEALQPPECYGGGVISRFIRSSNVFAYILLRSFPGPFFKQRAALLGDPDVNLPKIWQAWVLVPALFLFGMLAIALIANAILKALV